MPYEGQFVQDVWAIADRFREKRRHKKIRNAIAQSGGDEELAIKSVSQVDPEEGMVMQDRLMKRRMQERALADADREVAAKAQADKASRFKSVIGVLRQARDDPAKDFGTTFDELSPIMQNEYGISAEDIGRYRGIFTANPKLLDSLTDPEESVTLTPGMGLYGKSSGKSLAQQPFAKRPVIMKGGDGSSEAYDYDPNTGGFSSGGIGMAGQTPGYGDGIPGNVKVGDLSIGNLRNIFKAQESGGNYGAVNTSTGAMGAYQVMPPTGKALAAKLGVPWRPDLMTATSKDAVDYQDAIGGAAIQDSLSYSGGDPETLFKHYYGGPDRKIWGPKTRKYAGEMLDRLNGGRGNGAGFAGGGKPVRSAGKPKARPATNAEKQAAGLPVNAPYQIMPSGEFKLIATPKVPGAGASGGTAGGAKAAQAAQGQAAAVESTDRAIRSVDELLTHDGLAAVVGAPNPLKGGLYVWNIPGTPAANFKARLDTLKAQVFLPQVQALRGMGALSNAEGAKLEASIGVLATDMSEKEFRASLKQIKTDLQTAKQRMAPVVAAPQAGGKMVKDADGVYEWRPN